MKKNFLIILIFVCSLTSSLFAQNTVKTDPVAENMLIHQRHNGGWMKNVDYSKSITEEERQSILKDAIKNDATIDNNATYKEITYLIKFYKVSNNPTYLKAAERGLDYLFMAQYDNGGWPQYYPDTSLYRSQVTFNDNAMINVMTLMYDLANKQNGFELVDPSYTSKAKRAVDKGVSFILKAQIKTDGKLTAWAQQYNKKTIEPEIARKYELVGLTASETVGIVEFLMKLPNPSVEIKNSVTSAVNWLSLVKIKGYKTTNITDPLQASKRDRIVVPDPDAVMWARYYDIGTNRPFFCGRDGIKKYNLSEIENERRIGYAWYGNWPVKLLETDYPEWLKKWAN